MPDTIRIAPTATRTALGLIGLFPTCSTQAIRVAPIQLGSTVIEMLVNAGALNTTAFGKRQQRRLTRKKTVTFEAPGLCTRVPAWSDRNRMKRMRRIQDIGHGVATAPHQAIEQKRHEQQKENRREFVHDTHHGQYTAYV
ncbi:MAG TPA: hypothetical protein PKW52_08795 [Nitrospira sp.]|uniref:hypothetical protein n=1 Tax=Cognatazoarcus halotolerans TaxID=2686016 RepID=UPI00135A6B26|nr:hypothetical protein [Cognatazoarcus halotolerans]MBX3680149.1 hypothetical protein [Rhodocyclaceae bacterium]MCB1898315.1 hypothetical protein [Rhodocyclaceae bacterium]HQV11426.1 hypothetical protein [Nitrospira sp.]